MPTNITLKHTTETVHMVEYDDLETFIKQVTGQSYDCVASEEWGNDSNHRIIVKGEMDYYENVAYQDFCKRGKGSYILHTILEGLCILGRIPQGTYVINVCW